MKPFIPDLNAAQPHSVPGADSAETYSDKGLYRTYLKRVFDIVLALMLLPLLAPIIAVLWLMVKRDGGRGFYGQARVGLNGRHFTCYKMRTMVEDAEALLKRLCEEDSKIAEEWHVNQKLENDPRITGVGRFLRATSLDELPQIWNVLKGDMSFVGPRPFTVEQNDLYKAAGGQAYFSMRPGITGLWQIDGRGTTSFASRTTYDTRYYQELSFFGDVKLVLKTVNVVFARTGH